MVGGNWVVKDGAMRDLDLPDLIRRHSAAARAMREG
jgi:8-oxoguanine deaminase